MHTEFRATEGPQRSGEPAGVRVLKYWEINNGKCGAIHKCPSDTHVATELVRSIASKEGIA